MRIAWITDAHLNFVDEAVIMLLGQECRAQGADATLLTGDIAEANSILRCLHTFQQAFGGTVYFVAGNHDFYGASVNAVESMLSRQPEPLIYLTSKDVIELTPGVALVGDDGWYDGRNGDILGPQTMDLYDFECIADIKARIAQVPRIYRNHILQELLATMGDRATARAKPKVEEAFAKYKQIVFATHVPPFAGAAWYKGKPSEAYAQPFFSSQVMGAMLFEYAYENPDKFLTVLCGHSHYYGLYKPNANLECYTGYAKYGSPCIVRILEAEGDTLTMHSVK